MRFAEPLEQDYVKKALSSKGIKLVWVGCTDPGNLGGVVNINERDLDYISNVSHTIKFESQAGYLALESLLEAAFRVGYNDAKSRMKNAI